MKVKRCPLCGRTVYYKGPEGWNIQRPLSIEEIVMRALHEEPVYVQCLHPPQEGKMPPEWWDVLTTSGLGDHVKFMVYDDVPINLSENGVEYFMWAYEPTIEERETAYQKEEPHDPSKCRYYTSESFFGKDGGCIGTKEIDPCQGENCGRWEPKEG